jgi:hypothetical protein
VEVRFLSTAPSIQIVETHQYLVDNKGLSERPRYKRALQMVGLRMTSLRRDRQNGDWFARKGIPADVRDAYQAMHGQGWEARFRISGSTPPGQAKHQFAVWLGTIEARIAAIRNGEAGALEQVEPDVVRQLATRWQAWFVQRNADPVPPLSPVRGRTKLARRTCWQLFEEWVDRDRDRPAASTVNRWRAVFKHLADHFRGRDIATITPDEAQAWANGLVTEDRSGVTVNDIWIVSARSVFGWATKQERRYITANPFADVAVDRERRVRLRESKAFSREETRIILRAPPPLPPSGSEKAPYHGGGYFPR